jgi:hypothetical protein
MLRRLIPFKQRALSRCREIRDAALTARFSQKIRPESDYFKRAPAKLLAIIVDDYGVFSIAQVPPVRVAEKSIIPIIATDPAGVCTGQPIRCGNRVSIVKSDGDVPLGLTLPARDNPDARQGDPVAGNLKDTGELGVRQRRNQDNEAKAKAKQERHQHLLIEA